MKTLEAKYVEGDQFKMKLLPFSLEPKVQGRRCNRLAYACTKRDYINHLSIISNVVNVNELTSWLGISDGGFIRVRSGTIGGLGLEMIYQDKKPLTDPARFGPGQGDVAPTYGAGIYYNHDSGTKTSVGAMLPGDGEFRYRTNTDGVLHILGHGLDKNGRLPGTASICFKQNYYDGDSFYAGVHADFPSYMLDGWPEKHDGDRAQGKFGAAIAYSKRLSKNSSVTIAAGANNDFKNKAFCLTYTYRFGGNTNSFDSLILDSMKAFNKMNFELEESVPNDLGPKAGDALEVINEDLKHIELRYA